MNTISMNCAAAILALALASCASYTTGRYGGNLDDAALSHLKMDMSQREVRALIGTPTSVTKLSEGREMWTYMYRVEQADGATRFAPIPPDGKGPPEGGVMVMFFSTGGLAFVQRP